MDHHLARGTHGGIDMAVGDPIFLQEAMADFISVNEHVAPTRYPVLGGEPELVEAIRAHEGLGLDFRVVVANGAKHAILAALWALKNKTVHRVVHPEPYWLSYPTLAKLSGYDFDSSGWTMEGDIRVLTSPNNPDGSMVDSSAECDILDAVYASNLYGFDPTVMTLPRTRIAIGGASKLLGMSGHRVGWLITADHDLANKAAHYVEITTSGVSVPSQMAVAGILGDIARSPMAYGQALQQAAKTLAKNRGQYSVHIAPHCTEYRTDRGMFAFFKPKDNVAFTAALKATDVRMVPGEAFGASYAGWWRMTLGNSAIVTRGACEAIGKELSR